MIRYASKISLCSLLLFLTGCVPILFLPDTKFSPSLQWKTIKTEHFEIHFHQGEEKIAERAAVLSEEVHLQLSPLLRWEPTSRTQLILVDNEDNVTGTATPIPYNTITINLTPPAGTFFLINYDDWLRLVITHEYAHILHLDTVSEENFVFRKIFGRVPFILFPLLTSVPNLWQPTWMIEGLATYEETELGTSDRRDGTFSEMILRMAVLENNFPNLDQADGLDQWPSGEVPYLFGSKFYQFIAKRNGKHSVAAISKGYSGRAISFFVESNAEIHIGWPYRFLWKEWKHSLQQKYQEEKEKLEAQGLTASRKLTDRGYLILGPAISPDSKTIVYTEINADDYPSLRLINAEGTGDRALALRNSGFHVSWSPNGERIAYAQMEIYDNYSSYSDLYLIDVAMKKTKRLTHGLRARDPAFSPDGSQVFFIMNRLGQSQLAMIDLASLEIKILNEGSEDFQYAHPRWSPDGRFIALAVWHKGRHDIALFDPKTRSLNRITQDPPMDLNPAWSPDGKWVFFASERTGIFNIFAYSVSHGELYQVTNVLGGALMPYPSPDGNHLVFADYSAKGFDLRVMDLQKAAWNRVETSHEPVQVRASPSQDDSSDLLTFESSRPYSSLPTLLPRFWTPVLSADEQGLQLGLVTGGLDVLGLHKYRLAALYGFESDRVAYNFSYLNDQFYPSLRISVSDLTFLHADLLQGPGGQELDYWEQQQLLSADIIYPILKYRWSQKFSIGYHGKRLAGRTTIPTGFSAPPEGNLSGIRLGWEAGSAKQYARSISREDGRRFVLSYERMDDFLGSDFNTNRYLAGWYEYLTLPYLKHHVLAGRVVGGLATGDVLLQRGFQLGGPLITEEIITPDEQSYLLRGYPPRRFRGQRMALAGLEYRFPLLNIERGIRTWPFFFRRIHGAFFVDSGNAWDGGTRLKDFKTGVGGELKLDMNLAYHLTGLRFRIGVAHGLDEGGVVRGYLAAGNAF